tara:strand:+ start:45 stop:728 length:684 start_codon:yes stop_codon:yes gene_type:complete
MIHDIKRATNCEYKMLTHFGTDPKSVTIDSMVFDNLYKQLIDQCPQGWIDAHDQQLSGLAPVYTIKDEEGKEIFIDFYLRQLIMFDEVDTSKIISREGYKTLYYTSTQKIQGYGMKIEKFVYERLAEWMYEIIKKCVSETKDVKYPASMNTLMHDLLTITIQKKGVDSTKDFQGVACGVMFTAVYVLNKIELVKDGLIYMTAGGTNMEFLEDIIEFQKSIVSFVECK